MRVALLFSAVEVLIFQRH